jgi:RHH-type transcriptional regulator, proline utilization regulon repressor / proline dehydrogenase / delta 1-pyrroline-5-carboxylate dehydrogenase
MHAPIAVPFGEDVVKERTMGLFGRGKSKSTQESPSPPAPTSNGRAASGRELAMAGSAFAGSPDEERVLSIGSEMLSKARGHASGVLSAKFYSDALMNWSMKDPVFKVQLFRFVDAFPTLRTPDDIYDHLTDYLTQPGVTVPGVIDAAITAGKLAKSIAAGQISRQITGMASKFIAGTDAASALPTLKDLWKDGIGFSVDLLGEACVSDQEAEHYQRKYLDLVMNLPAQVGSWAGNPRLESDHLGGIPRTNVSIKISSLSARVDPIDTEGSIRELMRKIVPILEAARDRGVFVNFDMEQFALKDLTLELFMRCCEAVDFQAGLAMQAYLVTGETDARTIGEWAKRTGRVVTVRLVKGAYWDYQVIHSEQAGWPCPVWRTKRETDACFERMTAVLLDYCPAATTLGPALGLGPSRRAPGQGGVKLALGSHNVRSIAAAIAGLESRGLPRNAIELQMLHGMADQLKFAAAEMGLRVREYVPVGEMIPGMAYLVRRLLENTSNESWLKAGFLDNADPAKLLESPQGLLNGAATKPDLADIAKERHRLTPAVKGVGDGQAFFNESFRDFSLARVRDAFASAIARTKLQRTSKDQVLDEAKRMLSSASGVALAWGDVDPRVRARALTLAAAAMRQRRDELSAIMIAEAGKTWREADADTCEAIDFCEYYARLAVPMFERERIGAFIGELDEQFYQPRGVAVVIAPWNFPLAICCGMTVAALVTGNPVVIKPAEQTPVIAERLHEILLASLTTALRDAGIKSLDASAVVQLCPGTGESVGAGLVRDERVALVAFTGSRDVGLDILSAAAPGSPFGSSSFRAPSHVKKVIAEMGGKNALILDTSADLDEAVLAIRHSAFGFQGQKCSACSRLIVVDPQGPSGPQIALVHERLAGAMRALVIGDPAMPGTDIGPVIDRDAKAKIEGFISRAKAAGLAHVGLDVPTGLEQATGRAFVGPHIFLNVPETHELAREEIFGPVLAVLHARDFSHALSIVNSLDYKLTGGVFTRKPTNLERAKREFRVGNLYINRGITGALVARQPFGGFGMSGVGSKAGGRDYLLQFVEPRAITENTMRRGFAPEL